MVQAMSGTVQLHRSALKKKNHKVLMDDLHEKILFLVFFFWPVTFYTCVIEPPGLDEEMRGGGSGMVSGLTAASLPPSCGRAGSEGWPLCGNAAEDRSRGLGDVFSGSAAAHRASRHCWLCTCC